MNPFDEATRDAKKHLTRARYRAEDFASKYLTAALIKVTLPSVATAVLGVIFLPLAVGVASAAVIVVLIVYAVFSTRLLKRKDSELRHAWIANKRIQQHGLEQRIAVDNAILQLLGERPGQRSFRHVTPELRSTLAHVRREVRDARARAAAAEAVNAGTATDAQRRALKRFQRGGAPTPAKPPKPEPIRKRRDAHVAKRARLESEIQALASHDDIRKAMTAKEVAGARRTERDRQDAAVKADKAARDRIRRGKRPTTEEPEHVIDLRTQPNGDRDVSRGSRELTPEQIARGDARTTSDSAA